MKEHITHERKDATLGTCYPGQLTPVGVRQMIELGKDFRKHYVEKLNFLDKNFNPQQFFIRSTDFKRTVLTAQSVVMGMYPNLRESEFVEQKSDELNTENKIPIHVLDYKLENMYPRARDCARISYLRRLIRHSEEWKSKQDQAEEVKQILIKDIFESASYPVPRNKDFWTGLHNTSIILKEHKFELPPALEDKMSTNFF